MHSIIDMNLVYIWCHISILSNYLLGTSCPLNLMSIECALDSRGTKETRYTPLESSS